MPDDWRALHIHRRNVRQIGVGKMLDFINRQPGNSGMDLQMVRALAATDKRRYVWCFHGNLSSYDFHFWPGTREAKPPVRVCDRANLGDTMRFAALTKELPASETNDWANGIFPGQKSWERESNPAKTLVFGGPGSVLHLSFLQLLLDWRRGILAQARRLELTARPQGIEEPATPTARRLVLKSLMANYK